MSLSTGWIGCSYRIFNIDILMNAVSMGDCLSGLILSSPDCVVRLFLFQLITGHHGGSS